MQWKSADSLRRLPSHLPSPPRISPGTSSHLLAFSGASSHLPGISHLLEHLFFKGTERRNSRELMHAIESRGGHMNAFTSREYTCLYVKTLSQHLPMAMDVLSDVLNHSIFCDLEKERSVILEEIAAASMCPRSTSTIC